MSVLILTMLNFMLIRLTPAQLASRRPNRALGRADGDQVEKGDRVS
jgi:hypothetical protein